jgi:hypothetical protein
MTNKENKLIRIIETLENYEEASETLSQLMDINPNKAKELSQLILWEERGDVFFQSSSFDTLYMLDLNGAIEFAKDNLHKLEAYLLGAIINNVTSDSAISDENIAIKQFVSLLKEHLAQMSSKDLSQIEEVNYFYETYK